jgi:hypothetical protein
MNRGAQTKLENKLEKRWPQVQFEVNVASSGLTLPATAITPCSQIGLLSHR